MAGQGSGYRLASRRGWRGLTRENIPEKEDCKARQMRMGEVELMRAITGAV